MARGSVLTGSACLGRSTWAVGRVPDMGMIPYDPPGFIRPKAEAFAVNTWKHMMSRYSWFAAGISMKQLPRIREYRDEVVNLAAHEYVDRGDPEQDTVDAMVAVTDWHTMSLRSSINGLYTTSKKVHWPKADGTDQMWRLGYTSADFTSPATENHYHVRADDAGFDRVLDREVIRKVLAEALPRMTERQRQIFLLWLDEGAERGAAGRVGEQLGITHQGVHISVQRSMKEIAAVVAKHEQSINNV